MRLHKPVVFGIGVLMAALVLWTPAAAQSQDLTLTVIGTSRIIKSDISGAKDRAVGDGLTRAIEAAAVQLVPVETLTRNFEFISTLIYTDVRKFVRDYKVLATSTGENDFIVLMSVTIAGNDLKAHMMKIGILTEPQKLPKILILLAEQNGESAPWRYWWGTTPVPAADLTGTTAMQEALSAAGFTVIHPDTSQLPVIPKPDLSLDEALNLGGLSGADVVVAGRIRAATAQNVMDGDLLSFKATIFGRALWVSKDAEMLTIDESAVKTGEDPAAGGREALIQAATQAGQGLVAKLKAELRKVDQQGDRIAMTVNYTGMLGDFVKFRNALGATQDVKEVQVSEIKPHQAILQVLYDGEPQMIAESLMVQAFDDFGLNISDVSATGITITLTPK